MHNVMHNVMQGRFTVCQFPTLCKLYAKFQICDTNGTPYWNNNNTITPATKKSQSHYKISDHIENNNYYNLPRV